MWGRRVTLHSIRSPAKLSKGAKVVSREILESLASVPGMARVPGIASVSGTANVPGMASQRGGGGSRPSQQ